MPDRSPTKTTNLDRYGYAALPWSRPHDLLVDGPEQPGTTFFLATARPDGRPHMAGVGVYWHDGDLYFTCGPETRKARNLAANPACVFSVVLNGIDIVLEGVATRVDDPDLVEAVIARFREGGWPAEVKDGRIVGPYRPDRRPAAVGPVSVPVPHGLRRRDGRAVRRDPLDIQLKISVGTGRRQGGHLTWTGRSS